MASSNPNNPDSPPRELNIGVINPFALAEAMLGQRIDETCPESATIISDVLQSEYAELFDLRHHSVLYAGLKLNTRDNRAERVSSRDLRILTEEDMVTPDMSRIQKLSDLEHVGLKDVLETKVQGAYIRNGKVRLVLYPHALNKTLSNSAITRSLCETSTPFRQEHEGKGEWVPPNCVWQNMGELYNQVQRMRLVAGGLGGGMGMGMGMGTGMSGAAQFPLRTMRQEMMQHGMQRAAFNDPVQGAVANSWLIAAIFAVAWSDPYRICRDNAFMYDAGDEKSSRKHTLCIKFHSKGGENDAPTSTVEVDFDIPVNNSSGMPIYCRPSNRIGALWPSLYEKAFAKWITKGSSDHPDITQTSAAANGGDPVKAMAQINDGKPQYFFTHSRSGTDLVGIVRANCVNFKTIHPMTAFTYASGDVYKGCNIVGNQAYTVLGWASTQGNKHYIILRNPWGVTEPAGLATYPGLLETVDPNFWSPADMLDRRGVFALEAAAFKEYFACLGMAKQTQHNENM